MSRFIRLLLIARKTFPSYGWRTRWAWAKEGCRDNQRPRYIGTGEIEPILDGDLNPIKRDA